MTYISSECLPAPLLLPTPHRTQQRSVRRINTLISPHTHSLSRRAEANPASVRSPISSPHPSLSSFSARPCSIYPSRDSPLPGPPPIPSPQPPPLSHNNETEFEQNVLFAFIHGPPPTPPTRHPAPRGAPHSPTHPPPPHLSRKKGATAGSARAPRPPPNGRPSTAYPHPLLCSLHTPPRHARTPPPPPPNTPLQRRHAWLRPLAAFFSWRRGLRAAVCHRLSSHFHFTPPSTTTPRCPSFFLPAGRRRRCGISAATMQRRKDAMRAEQAPPRRGAARPETTERAPSPLRAGSPSHLFSFFASLLCFISVSPLCVRITPSPSGGRRVSSADGRASLTAAPLLSFHLLLIRLRPFSFLTSPPPPLFGAQHHGANRPLLAARLGGVALRAHEREATCLAPGETTNNAHAVRRVGRLVVRTRQCRSPPLEALGLCVSDEDDAPSPCTCDTKQQPRQHKLMRW